MTEASVDEADNAPADETNRLVPWVAGIAIAAALGGSGLLYYGTNVCNEQLAQSGQKVTVCRSLEMSDPPMISLGLVVLVALTAFFTEISGFGISLKRDVRRTKKKADAAYSTSRSAEQTSELAQEVALTSSRAAEQPTRRPAVHEKLDQLISEYNGVRASGPSSSAKTQRMTTVVRRMVSLLSGIATADFAPDAYVSDKDNDGRRLAAYAYVYSNPDSRFAPMLVGAIRQEETRFGQYWAIRALRRVISIDPVALDLNSRRELEDILRRLGPNTDRAYELRQVLEGAQRK
jgi:hypothetical protein